MRAAGGVLGRAHDAARRGDVGGGVRPVQAAEASGQVGLADLPVLADAAYGSGHLDVTIETWERAYAGLMAAGETTAAAGAAVRAGDAPAVRHRADGTRAWLAAPSRAAPRRSRDDARACLVGGRPQLRADAERGPSERPGVGASGHRGGFDGATRRPPPSVASQQARLLILDGEVEQGLGLLEEAGMAAISGDLDPLSTGVVYCELVCALQGLAQYDLAEQWTEAMERWSHTNAIGSLHGRCRVHRAEILRLRGRCHEAEAEALQACEELRPYLRRELGWPISELGRIRLRTGDITGAHEAFLAAHQAGWDAQPGLAQVHLARGDIAAAAASIDDALERPTWVPSKELPPATELQRAPLLAVQVEIAIADGNIDAAQAAAEELAAVASPFPEQGVDRICCARPGAGATRPG